MMKWHNTLRESLVKTGKTEDYHPVYNGFVPAQRLNVDQSPLPFAIDTKQTYEHIEPKNNLGAPAWIRFRRGSVLCRFAFVLKDNNQEQASYFVA